MKKGINVWSFKRGIKLEDCMTISKKAGFNGIELSLDEEGEINLKSKENELVNLKTLAENIGIEIPSLASGLYWKYSFTDPNPQIRKKALEIAVKQIEFAKLLGADTVLIVPGLVKEDVSYEEAFERALGIFAELKKYAEKLQIHIGLENVWNKFLLSPIEFRDFIDKVNSPFVGAYFDVGNVVYNGYPEQWIKILGKRIKKVHFKDFRRSIGNINGFVDLLNGDVNFPAVVEALECVRYDDYVIAEMTPYNYHSDQVIYNTSQVMDRILGKMI